MSEAARHPTGKPSTTLADWPPVAPEGALAPRFKLPDHGGQEGVLDADPQAAGTLDAKGFLEEIAVLFQLAKLFEDLLIESGSVIAFLFTVVLEKKLELDSFFITAAAICSQSSIEYPTTFPDSLRNDIGGSAIR